MSHFSLPPLIIGYLLKEFFEKTEISNVHLNDQYTCVYDSIPCKYVQHATFGVPKRTFSRQEYLILMDMSYPQGLSVNLM